MLDLNAEMAELWGSLGAPAPGRARLVQFVAARGGEGTSSVAREFARFAARRAGRSVWLIELDLLAQAQVKAVRSDPERYGELSGPVAASPDDSMFFSVRPPQEGPGGAPVPDARYLVAHGLKGSRMWVTRFRNEALQPRQTLQLNPGRAYWEVMRGHADLIVVDSPAAERSQAALMIAPFMDQTVLVVAADETDVRAPALLKDSIAAAGGRCAGVFFNRVTVHKPAFLKALLP
jgi:Mrp family chromosome partitioning ATPase